MIPSQQLHLACLLKQAALDPATGGMAGATLGPLGTTMYGAMNGETGRGLRAGGRALLEGLAGGAAGMAAGTLIPGSSLAKMIWRRSLAGTGMAIGAGHGAYKSFKKTDKKKKKEDK